MTYYELINLLNDIKVAFLNSKCFIGAFVLFIVATIILLFIFIKGIKKYLEVDNINISNFSLTINRKNIDAAHKMYIELQTRKIGLPFQDEDVIVEIYDSWYASFGALRQLAKEIKPNEHNNKLIITAIEIMNEILRPHLTTWQAKFRRWYDYELEKEENRSLDPQDIQKKYLHYEELVIDLKEKQKSILFLMNELKRITKLNLKEKK